ncbi:MAG: hypothetical protein ACE5KS_02660, partial [Woeseiaceae bacterium]
MNGYTATLESGEAIFYRDRKRWFWLMSVIYPLEPFLGIWLHAETGHEGWLLLPLALGYVLAPILDWILGEDETPEQETARDLLRLCVEHGVEGAVHFPGFVPNPYP